MELLGLIGNFIIVIGLLLLPLYMVKRLVPGSFRVMQRLTNPIIHFIFLTQATRRGWIYAILVHFFGISALVIFILGIATGTFQAIIAALVFAAIAIVAKRLIDVLRRAVRARHSLPGRRR